MMQAQPWMLSARSLAQAYRRGTLDPVDALASVLERMEDVNPRINAVVSSGRRAARCRRWTACPSPSRTTS